VDDAAGAQHPPSASAALDGGDQHPQHLLADSYMPMQSGCAAATSAMSAISGAMLACMSKLAPIGVAPTVARTMRRTSRSGVRRRSVASAPCSER
jgi:hypothetical protein